MTWTIVRTARFDREVRRFLKAHPQLRPRFGEILEQLAADPHTPSLRLHALRGEFDGLHAVSLTYAYRLVLILHVSEREITLIDIGSHDDVYR